MGSTPPLFSLLPFFLLPLSVAFFLGARVCNMTKDQRARIKEIPLNMDVQRAALPEYVIDINIYHTAPLSPSRNIPVNRWGCWFFPVDKYFMRPLIKRGVDTTLWFLPSKKGMGWGRGKCSISQKFYAKSRSFKEFFPFPPFPTREKFS